MGVLLGGGDEGVSGDMGFEPDTPSSPHPGQPTCKRPCEMPWGMNERQLGLDSIRFSAGKETLRQCVKIDRVGWWGFGRPETFQLAGAKPCNQT